MKKTLLAFILLFTVIGAACQSPVTMQTKSDVKYTCPMHPQILEDHPGSCPICGMALVQAQIGQRHYYIGGSFNYNYDEAGTTSIVNFFRGVNFQGATTYTNNHITNFQVSPDFGFFLSNKWAIGLQFGYMRTSGTETNNYTASDSTTKSYIKTDNYHTSAIGIGVHFRYYCMLSDRIGIFPQFGITTSNNLDNFNEGTLSIGGNPNIVFFATPRLGINMGFGNLEYDLDYKSKTGNFNLGFNTNIGFGLNYYWGK